MPSIFVNVEPVVIDWALRYVSGVKNSDIIENMIKWKNGEKQPAFSQIELASKAAHIPLGNDVVLDPFCGTGTTNVECKKNGIVSIGLEASPITHFASETKCNWLIDTRQMIRDAQYIAKKASLIITNGTPRTLPDEQDKLLLTNSICKKPLSQVLELRDVIYSANSEFENYYLLALAKHLVCSYSNLKFGPEIGISRKKIYDTDVVGIWMSQIKKMKEDIDTCRNTIDVPTQILYGDARYISTVNFEYKANYVITSPPYPNEKDYSRTTRLESVILRFMNSKDELRTIKKNFIRSNTKNVYKDDNDCRYVENIPSISILSNTIEEKRLELNKTSGFEKLYSKVVKLYFGGMAKHLLDLKHHLADNAKLAYVVGDQASYFQIPIRTAELLAEIAENVGYEVEGIETFRKRYATATGNWLNENVLILKYKGE